MIFSQEELCAKSVELSNLYYSNSYEKLLNELEEFKSYTKETNLNQIIDFNSARLFFYLKKYDEAENILLNLINSNEEVITNGFECDKPVFVDEYEVENIFNLSGFQLKQKKHLLFSDVYFEKGDYGKALENLKKSKQVSTNKKQFFGCGNAMILDIMQYEHRNFEILTKLGEIEEANQSGISILFLTENENLINKVKANLLKKYSIKEIRNEFKSKIETIKKGFVSVSGSEIETNYIDFFQYKILLYNTIEEDKKDILNRSLAYKILTSNF